MKTVKFFLIFAFVLVGTMSMCQTDISWEEIDTGLYLGEYKSPLESFAGDNMITILKIDPSCYQFNLFSAKEPGEELRDAKRWAIAKDQIAIINAGMFQGDYKTNVGYMKDYDFVNNGKLNSNNAILAFNAKDTYVPAIQIIDRESQDWDWLKTKYNSYTQSIRMVNTSQHNCWKQQDLFWSMVVFGIDKKGNALFIFTRSPYSVHDFIDILLNAPLDIYNMIYLEGGPEASLYLKCGIYEVSRFGSYESNFNQHDYNDAFWKMPNVIGISKK